MMSRTAILLGMLLLLPLLIGLTPVSKTNSVFIHGVMDVDSMMQLLKILDGKSDTYYIAFDTEGGVVPAVELVMDRIKDLQRGGTKFYCHAIGKVASMGLYLYNVCDVLTAYPEAVFTFHKVRVYADGIITVETMEKWIKELNEDQIRLDTPLIARLQVPAKEFDNYSRKEHNWKVDELLRWAPKYPIHIIQRKGKVTQ